MTCRLILNYTACTGCKAEMYLTESPAAVNNGSIASAATQVTWRATRHSLCICKAGVTRINISHGEHKQTHQPEPGWCPPWWAAVCSSAECTWTSPSLECRSHTGSHEPSLFAPASPPQAAHFNPVSIALIHIYIIQFVSTVRWDDFIKQEVRERF